MHEISFYNLNWIKSDVLGPRRKDLLSLIEIRWYFTDSYIDISRDTTVWELDEDTIDHVDTEVCANCGMVKYAIPNVENKHEISKKKKKKDLVDCLSTTVEQLWWMGTKSFWPGMSSRLHNT